MVSPKLFHALFATGVTALAVTKTSPMPHHAAIDQRGGRWHAPTRQHPGQRRLKAGTDQSPLESWYMPFCASGDVFGDDVIIAQGGLASVCGAEDDSLTFYDRVTYYYQSAYAFVSAGTSDDEPEPINTCTDSFINECMMALDRNCGKNSKGWVWDIELNIACGRGNRGDTI